MPYVGVSQPIARSLAIKSQHLRILMSDGKVVNSQPPPDVATEVRSFHATTAQQLSMVLAQPPIHLGPKTSLGYAKINMFATTADWGLLRRFSLVRHPTDPLI